MKRKGDIFPKELENAIFFTEADRIQQRMYRIGRVTLERKVKIAILLSEIVVIPPTHILESPISTQLFVETPELLTSGVFALSLPSKFPNFQEFLRAKREEFSYGFDYSSKRLDRLAEFLDEHCRCKVRRDVDAMRQDFTQSLLSDLNDPLSRLSQKLNLPDSDREALVFAISQSPVSRDRLIFLAEKLDPQRRIAFLEHIQALYCLSGARGNNSDPLVHPRIIPFYEDKFSKSLGAYDPRLFSAVLKGIGLRQDLLDHLSLKEVLELREETPVKKFRSKYLRLISDARKGIPLSAEALVSGETLEAAIMSLLDRKLYEEFRKVQLHSRIKQIWSLTSFATTLLSAIASTVSLNPLTLGATVVSGAISALNTFTGLTDPLIDHLFRTSGTEFIVFATHIVEYEAKREKKRMD